MPEHPFAGYIGPSGDPVEMTEENLVRPDPTQTRYEIDHRIDTLHHLREQVADTARRLAIRELDGRVLRLTIETELRQAGTVKTEAERQAKVDPRYLAHERESIKLAYDHAVLNADAEAARFEIELQIAVLKRSEVNV